MVSKVLIQLCAMALTMSLALVGFNAGSPVESLDIPAVQIYEPLESQKSDLEVFMRAVAHRESGGNSRIVNAQGMMGKYQFSRTTLRSLRRDVTPNQFLSNPHVQDTIMHLYLKHNYTTLRRYISRYEGKVYKGVRITTSGVLAAAHLGGAGSVIKWFNDDSHSGLVDANGTSIREYMTKFADYPIKKYVS